MILTLAALAGLTTLAAAQPTTTSTKGGGPNKGGSSTTSTKAKSELEKALEQALAHNPDLKVAQAKANEADAQLARARLQVLQKVVDAYQAIEHAKVEVKAASGQLDAMKRLKSTIAGGVTDNELRKVEAALSSAKMKLDKAQSELDFLVGKAPQRVTVNLLLSHVVRPKVAMAFQETPLTVLPNATVTWAQLASAYPANVWAPPSTGPAADRIRKALEKKVNLKLLGTPARDALKMLQKEAGDLHIQAATKDDAWSAELTASLSNIPFTAALQLLEDALGGYRVVVREYGLLIVPQSKVPPGAAVLADFLKSKSEAKPTTNPGRR
jgi:hypothetical protein